MNWSSDTIECGMHADWRQRLSDQLASIPSISESLHDIVDSLRNGEHLSFEQGLKLWNHSDLSEIAHLAHICKTARFGDDVFFNSNPVSYTHLTLPPSDLV